jgi:Putative transposase/Transposase zinc-binding domain
VVAARAPVKRPAFDVADVFRAHGEAYRQGHHSLTGDQAKVMRAIQTCRTAVLGGHVDLCLDCGVMTPSYNSCRNRHCPKCQGLEQAQWITARRERTLPVHYFHVVFTLPAELRAVVKANQELLYSILLREAGNTLVALGESRLAATVGVTEVLHTWTRDLSYHPHVHCIVTGGGLSLDGDRWVTASKRYLFPVKVLSRLFRGKFLAAFRDAYVGGKLHGTSSESFAALVDKLYRTEWVIYAKRPFGSVEHVFQYLGRYTHRVGISNQRLLSITDREVRFLTKEGKSVALSPEEFIRRFLQHVLPYGFVKIRHYGLLAPANVTTKLRVASRLLVPPSTTTSTSAPAGNDTPREAESALTTWQDTLLSLTGVDVRACRHCGGKRLETHPLSFLDTG